MQRARAGVPDVERARPAGLHGASNAALRAAWDAAPWAPMAERLSAIHDHLVARLAPRAGEAWLDVGTGTGAVALRAARAGARVTGVDLAPSMVATARRLAAEAGLDARFDVGDAERLPYPDASFAVVASALGVFLAPDHAAVARELARVCRPGGRLGIVAWRPDPAAERLHAPFRSPRAPGAGDPRDWGRRERVRARLGDDFELTFEDGVHVLEAESAEELWRLRMRHDGSFKTLVTSLPPARAAEYRRAYVAYEGRFRHAGGVTVPRAYLLTIGRRRNRASS